MQDDYTKNEVVPKGQINWNTVASAIGFAGGVPAIAGALNGNGLGGIFNGGSNQKVQQLEGELVYEKSKNYTDKAVIAGLREGEQNRKEIIQQVVANKEALVAIATKQECEEKYAKELAALREANMRLTIKDEVTTATAPLKAAIDGLHAENRALRQEFAAAMNLEAERRDCADNKIVNYANSAFAPKMITDYTPDATATTTATLYNPLCGCGCGCGKRAFG